MASSSSSCTFILVTGVILTLTCGSLSSLGLPPPTPSLPSYETKIACEGGHLRLECEEGTKINLIRANFGRFSISICNTQGNLEWSVNCMSRRSFRVIQEMCGNRSDCTLSASSVYFGDPCPGVHKYLEVHYQCLPESLKTSTSILSERRPSSSVMKTLPKVSSSNSQRTRGGGGSSSSTSLSSSSIDSFGVSSFSNNNNQTSVTEGVRSNNKNPSASSSSSTLNQSTSPPSLSTKFLSSSSTPASSSVSVSPSSSSPSTLSSSSLSSTTSTTTSGPPLIPPSLFDPDSPSSVSISHSREGSSPSSSGGSGSSSSSSSESSNRFLLHDPVVDTRDFDFSPDPSLHPPPSSSGTSTATGGVGIGSPGSPSMTDDDYEGTSSSLDSMSDVSSTSSSSFLPLSDNLRVLLTVGCVFGVICLFLTMLSLVMSTTHGGIGRGNFFLGGSSSSSASSSLPPSSSSSHHKRNRAAKLELQVKENLTLCLLMVEVLFLIGINISQQQPTIGFFCGLVSASLHYFFLCIFIWLFFDGFTLYLALLKHHEEDDIMINAHNHNHNSLHHQQPHQNNLNLNSSISHHLPHHSSSSIISCASKRKPCRCYLIIAYGLPLIVQIVSSILDSSTSSSSESSPSSPFAHCWLRSDKYFVLTFVGPVIAVLSANFLFLAITVVCSNYGSLFALDRESSKQHYNTGSAVVVINGIATTTGGRGSSSTEHPLRLRLKTSLAVFVVMSLTLTALFVSLCQELPEDQVVFTSCLYVFAVFNPIQVIVLLILFSQSSSTVKNNSLRVLSSLGFLDAAKSPSSSAGRFKGEATCPEVLPVQPIIPLPHASTLNLSSVGIGNGGADVDGREGSIHSKPYSSDYGFRGNLNATSAQHHLNNYRSPVYGSSSGAIATSSAIRGVRSGHIHTKQCLQYPCQYPHIVEHVYESIDDDPYIARLLLPIPTPLIGRKASGNGHDSQQAQLSSSSHSVLPAIIRDNTNHSTIICSSALTPGVVSGGLTTTGVVRASVNNKSHLVSNITTGGGMSSLQQNHQPQQPSADQQAAATAAKLRHESTLI